MPSQIKQFMYLYAISHIKWRAFLDLEALELLATMEKMFSLNVSLSYLQERKDHGKYQSGIVANFANHMTFFNDY